MERFFPAPEALVDHYALHSLRLGRPLAALLLVVAGCAGNSGAGPAPGSGIDLAAPCIGPKCGDPNGCDKESDCTAPERPHCEVMSHKCVPCLADTDCELGKICFPATHTCNQ